MSGDPRARPRDAAGPPPRADAPPRVLIVADDLTGAADACAAFVTRGVAGAVVFDDASSDRARVADRDSANALTTADAIAYSTETRSSPIELARDRVRDVTLRWTAAVAASERPTLWFKKIDSTLRGHVGVEIEACLTACGAPLAIVTPAFPAMGRTVDAGLLHVTGRGAMPPIDIAARLTEEGVSGCLHVARPSNARADSGADEPTAVRVPASHAAWADGIAAAARSGARVLVCDAVHDEDLDAIAAGAPPGPVLWAGSAGLAHALARQHALRRGSAGAAPGVDAAAAADVDPDADAPAARVASRSGSIVFLIGSNHAVTVEQRRRLLQDAGVVRASVGDVDGIAWHLSQGVPLLIDVWAGAEEPIVAHVVHLVAHAPVAGLVLSGGATAARVCRHLRATAIRLEGEMVRGVPFGTVCVAAGPLAPVVLKSGGFGDDETLLRALQFLTPPIE